MGFLDAKAVDECFQRTDDIVYLVAFSGDLAGAAAIEQEDIGFGIVLIGGNDVMNGFGAAGAVHGYDPGPLATGLKPGMGFCGDDAAIVREIEGIAP